MIPTRIPKVGATVKFGESNQRYTVKKVAEDVVPENDGYKGTGDGWVILSDDYGNEFATPFSRFVPKEPS